MNIVQFDLIVTYSDIKVYSLVRLESLWLDKEKEGQTRSPIKDQ